MPLVEFHNNDWLRQELPERFGHVGQAALAPLQAYLADRAHSEWGHLLVAQALGAVAQQYPELHDAVVPILSDVLRHAEQYDVLACTFAAALGNEPESAFARLMREHDPPCGPPAGSPVSPLTLTIVATNRGLGVLPAKHSSET